MTLSIINSAAEVSRALRVGKTCRSDPTDTPAAAATVRRDTAETPWWWITDHSASTSSALRAARSILRGMIVW